jgi:2-methylcitrate dehydratase PrpD
MSTAELVDLVHRKVESAEPSALAAARTLVLDVLGVAIAGSVTPEGRSVARVMSAARRHGEIAVPGAPDRYDVMTAALVSGTAAYSIGLTDTHAQSITHPGPSVVSAALAAGQATRASGEEFLRAVIGGCEAVVRIGAVVNPSHRERGFHPTATCNPFGAALAASYLLGASRQQELWALGLVGSMSGGLYEFRREGAMLMALHGGLPAANGVLAALLAADGFTGPTTVLEGPEGFFSAYADDIRLGQLLAEPSAGAASAAVQQLSLRPYCACRYAHAGIDGLEQLWQEHGKPKPDEIAEVVIQTHRVAVEQETEPVSVVGARLSTRFNIALALVHGPRLSEVTPEDLDDKAVKDIARRVVIEEDEELTVQFPRLWACRAIVRLRDGRALERRVDSPRGEPGNPMSPDEIEQKFTRLAQPVIGPRACTRLAAAVRDLDRAADLSDVIDAMTATEVMA